jgi:DNA-binding response OmpR family regulator
MVLPPILVVGLDADAAQPLIQLLTRIGLANPTLVRTLPEDAATFLSGCATSRLPVVVLACASPGVAEGLSIIEWMRRQPDAIAAIDAVAILADDDEASQLQAATLGVTRVTIPVEMRSLIAALKALALPEKARIDPATLMVQVELWPRTAAVSRQ